MNTPGRPDRRIWRDTGADADDEIAFHLEMRERDLRERGLSPTDARAEARRRFGPIDHITRQVRAIDDHSARHKGGQACGLISDRTSPTRCAACGARPASPRSPS